MSTDYGMETVALHGGYLPDSSSHSVEVPLYLSNAFSFDSTQHGADLFSLKQPGYIYSRLNNPTVEVLERRIALLDNGCSALGFSSGHAAIFSCMLNLCCAGDEIVSSINIYGGAINMLGVTLNRIGIQTVFVRADDLNEWENAITDKTRCLFVEAVGNPNANVADIAAIAEIAHRHQLPLIVDSTFTTPALIRPIDYGADIVVHSATKFLSGHGNVMGGLVVDSGRFCYKENPRFALYNQPDPSYHGLVYADLGKDAFIARLRSIILRDLGGCMSAFNAFEILNGIETLSLRMKKHCENALIIAKWLQNRPEVLAVHHPMLPSSPTYALAKKYLPNGVGGVFTFELNGSKEQCAKLIDHLKLFVHCANVGDTKSLVIHPATTTHSQLSTEQLKKAGISETNIRLSVGLEDAQDLIADLNQAFQAAQL